MKHFYFKVQIGYGVVDYISIDESELEKAIKAQITGMVAIFNGGTVSGNSIISITPDYNREMGWNIDYKPNGEDFRYIGSKRIDEYRNLLEDISNKVSGVKKLKGDYGDDVQQLTNKFKI